MLNGNRFTLGASIFVGLPLCLMLAAGCSKPDDTGGPSGPNSGGKLGGPDGPGGSGGKMGGTGGNMGGSPGGGKMGGGPIAESASGAEIYTAKCGCHGPGGAGGKAPTLTGTSSRSDSDLFKIVHDGKEKMPSFSSQLSDAQIKKVVTQIKSFKP